MKFLAIIQARTGSTRLPGKVLFNLKGKTVLEHVVNRVRYSNFISDIVVATTLNIEDLKVVKICTDNNIRVFCGSQNDVLDRFYQAAKILHPENIVRVTSDCPLIDPYIIDSVIQKHLDENSDYTANCLEETFPEGEDVEVFTYKALDEAWRKAILASEREHVTPFIKKHPEKFKLVNLAYKENLSSKRWTLDNKEDFELINIIFKNLYDKNQVFGLDAILKFLEKNPELENINAFILKNAGYQKSLREDRELKLDYLKE